MPATRASSRPRSSPIIGGPSRWTACSPPASSAIAAWFDQPSQGTGAEAGEDVVAIRREEIAVRGPRNARTRGPAAAAQYLARAEPGLRVVRVRIGGKPGERQKVRRRPFPDVADHLPAAEGAVALGARRNIDRPVEGKV